MRILRTCSILAITLSLGLGVAACEKEKGPAEKFGEKVDAAASDAKAAAEKAKEDIKKAADDAHGE
jgi:hypothetical protein